MRIIFNLISVPLRQGAIVREVNLIRYLSMIDKSNEYMIVGQDAKRFLFLKFPSNFQYCSVNFLNRTLWEIFELPGIVKSFNADLIYSPHHKSIFRCSCKKIITICNAAPFDPNVIRDAKLKQKLKYILLRYGTKLSVYNSDYVIFLSKYLKNTLSNLGINPQRSQVIYFGIPSTFEPKGYFPKDMIKSFNLDYKYILMVSHLFRYKNILELIKAYVQIKDSISVHLIIAGRLADKSYYKEILKYIKSQKIEDYVHFIGHINHQLLPYLYSNCFFFVFSSTCENSPGTLVEAMACGAPIACSNLSGMPEKCGDAALYFNPNNIEDIASAFLEMSNNSELRDQLREKSLLRAREFSWEKSARQTLEIFEELNSSEKRLE